LNPLAAPMDSARPFGGPASADWRPLPDAPLTVLHVTAPARFGGLESVVCSLSAGQRSAGHRVHVAATLTGDDPAHPFVRAARETGAEVHAIVASSREYRKEWAALTELCRRIRPSVVHTHGYRSDVMAGAVARRLGIPAVATVHGFVRGSWKSRLYEWLQLRSYRRFDAVAAVSRPQVGEIAAAGVDAARIHLIPNAFSGRVDRSARAAVRAEMGLAPELFHVGWVGRLSREKGADVLLEALPELSDLPVQLSFVGDGPERPALEARARELGVAERVRWHGFVEDASRLLPALDAFVLSSRTEGTPICLLEAMSAETPIVATRVGGVPDVVGPDEALLVPAEDSAAIARAVREVYADPERARGRVQAATRRLAERYDPSAWFDRYVALYRSIQPIHSSRRVSR
jgi:glycosyltransferase involved in cell wall biosynthesis